MTDEPILDQPVTGFLDRLASAAPTPGGGSVAALSGALAAGLLVMVCDLTLGNRRYAAVADEMAHWRALAEQQRIALQELVQDDVAAFTGWAAAYRLPRGDATRAAALQRALQRSTEVPLATIRAVAALLPACAPLAGAGNRLAVSDVGAALHLIVAAARSAALSVDINLAALDDDAFRQAVRAETDALLRTVDDVAAAVLPLVAERIAAA
jgi:formiminotetrahydrofolate cyclodeaminase